jgi:hypothetical protein
MEPWIQSGTRREKRILSQARRALAEAAHSGLSMSPETPSARLPNRSARHGDTVLCGNNSTPDETNRMMPGNVS